MSSPSPETADTACNLESENKIKKTGSVLKIKNKFIFKIKIFKLFLYKSAKLVKLAV